jgi:hypothetical protein
MESSEGKGRLTPLHENSRFDRSKTGHPVCHSADGLLPAAPVAAEGRSGEGEHDHLFAGHRRNVVVEHHGRGTGGLANKLVEHLAAGDYELATELFEEFGSLAVSRSRSFEQPLLGSGENSFEVDKQPVFHEMGMDVFRAPAHELLLES